MNFVAKHQQRGHGLSACADQGTVFWSRGNGLVFGIVAGMKATGEKVLIVNNPIERKLYLEQFGNTGSARWFLDPQNDTLNNVAILESAFTDLKNFGQESDQKYPPDFRFEFETLSAKIKTKNFDQGLIQTLSHVLLIKDSKSAIARLFKSLGRLPKRASSKTSRSLEARTGFKH